MISQVPSRLRRLAGAHPTPRHAGGSLLRPSTGTDVLRWVRDDAGGVRLATPEKALLDTLYLAPARSRLFASLPEIEIPKGFDRRKAMEWVPRIPAGPRRLSVERRLDRLLKRKRRS